MRFQTAMVARVSCFSEMNRRALKLWIVALWSVALVSGCGYGDWPSKYDGFFSMPSNQWSAAILEFPAADQLQLHIHATCNVHPPYEHLARVIVKQRGEALVPVIRDERAAQKRVTTPLSECRAYALNLVVSELARRGVAVDVATPPHDLQSAPATAGASRPRP